MAEQETSAHHGADGTCAHRPRRTFLRGAALAGGVVLANGTLAACGSSDEDSGSEAGAKESGSGDGADTGPLGAASDVKVGSGKIFADQKVVVTQPTAGTYAAFSAVCTHQGCVVSEIVGKSIKCDCHGSEFSIEDGSVLEGPAGKPLAKKQVTESGGQLTLG